MAALRPMFVTGSLVHGGAERHAIGLMNRLAERGHDCHALYVKDDPSQLARIRLRSGGTVRCAHAGRFLDLRAIDDFAAHLRRVRPSLLVAANGYALMNATLANARAGLGLPLVVVYHTTRLIDLKEQVKALIDRPFFWHADRSVFVCETQRRYWLRRGLGSRRNAVIHNGVDSAHFVDTMTPAQRHALRRLLGLADGDYVVGLSAVLRPEKNPVQLVEAVAALRRGGLPAKALLIGDGPMRAAVEARAAALGIAADVVVTGLVQDVRPYISVCDAMALCSLSETFSLAALEAMAMARPVVLSEVGGAAEMVFPGENGFLFPVGDTDALASRLAVLAPPKVARRMGANARAIVESSFSETTMVDRYERLLAEVCAEHAAAAAPRRSGAPINLAGHSGRKE